MNSKSLFLYLSLALIFLINGKLAANDRCEVYAPTLSEARALYEQTCTLPRADCDPVDGQWVCSSHRLGYNSQVENVPLQPNEPDNTENNVSNSGDGCAVIAGTLIEAYRLYGSACSEPRIDCDPVVGGQWMCASYNNPQYTGQPNPEPKPDPTPTPEPEPTPTPEPEPEPTPNQSSDDRCEAVGSNLSQAISNYAQACSLPRRDCDPTGVNGAYFCASYLNPTLDSDAVVEPPAQQPEKPPVETPVENPKAPISPTTQILSIEAESASLNSSWVLKRERSGYTGNGYIQWTGSNKFGQPGVGVLNYTFKIKNPGIYQLQLRSRSIGGADVTVNNDSWVRIVNGPAPFIIGLRPTKA